LTRHPCVIGDKNTFEKERETLRAEYNKKQRQMEDQLDELKRKNRDIENCLGDIDSVRLGANNSLYGRQSDLYQHGAHEDLKLFPIIEDGLTQDCRAAFDELF